MSNNPVDRGLEEKWAHEENQRKTREFQAYLKDKAKVQEHLKTNPGQSAKDVAKALGITEKNAEQALKEIAAETKK